MNHIIKRECSLFRDEYKNRNDCVSYLIHCLIQSELKILTDAIFKQQKLSKKKMHIKHLRNSDVKTDDPIKTILYA